MDSTPSGIWIAPEVHVHWLRKPRIFLKLLYGSFVPPVPPEIQSAVRLYRWKKEKRQR